MDQGNKSRISRITLKGRTCCYLEDYKDQLPDFDRVLVKVMFRKTKESRQYLLSELCRYLKMNPLVEVLDIIEGRKIEPRDERFRYILKIRFSCSGCKKSVEESVNLISIWYPHFYQGKAYCESCVEDSQ